ncbi:MAG: outer membrane protein assembly factor BamE [Betaproteobacteria bacterium]|nr:outer membrane protein assembly factor BamE [Betaproteobacteria bacterium]
MRKLLILLVVSVLAGCKQMPDVPAVISPYKVDIQQGNAVTQEMVAKLKAGMTRAQVRFVLGSPLVVDPFRTDRWDYVYMYQKQGKETQRRRLTVIFEGDKLVRVEGDVVPADTTRETEKPAEKPPLAATPAAKPGGTAADKPAAAIPAVAKPVEKPAAAAEAPKTDAAKTDEKKEKPTEKGFFGRMLEKIGF